MIEDKLYKNKEWLYNKIINERKRNSEIAKELNVCESQIIYWAKKFDIFSPRGTIIDVDGKNIRTIKEVRYINNIPHIECSYLKIFLPISDFQIRKYKHGKLSYSFEQPSRTGRRQIEYNRNGIKPREKINKIIDGKLYRKCKELNTFLPIENFPVRHRYGKSYYSNVSRQGKKNENLRNIKSTRRAIKRWKQENKHKVRISTLKRIESKRNATPKWLTEKDLNDMKTIYLNCNEVQKQTNIKHNVHHIYPLHGEDNNGNHISCGLNVPWNLAVITEKLNFTLGSLNPEYHNYNFD